MVVDYLQTCDFLVFISEASLKKLIRDENCKIVNAQTMAYGIFPRSCPDAIK